MSTIKKSAFLFFKKEQYRFLYLTRKMVEQLASDSIG